MDSENYEQITALSHPEVGLSGFLVIHKTTVGPAFGGIRLFPYPTRDEALRDCMRLAHAMTEKCLLAGVPAGGGKIVLVEGEGMDRRASMQLLGHHLEAMGGRLVTGPDLGTRPEDLAEVGQVSRFVVTPEMADYAELGLATAAGVVEAMRATGRVIDGDGGLKGVKVVVQGAGRIGSWVVRLLHEEGAHVYLAELDQEKAEGLHAELGIELVDPATAFDIPCDIFSPCARGGVIHDLTLERLSCRAVIGAANNQLATPGHGLALHRRGILYAPDTLVNAGGIILASSRYLGGNVPARESCREIGNAVESILRASREKDLSPSIIARDEAARRLQEAKDAAGPGPLPLWQRVSPQPPPGDS